MSELRTILTNIDFLPAWADSSIRCLAALSGIVYLMNVFLSNLQKPPMKSMLQTMKAIAIGAIREIGKLIEPPIKHPRLELTALALSVVACFVMALFFFAMFLLSMYFGISAEQVSRRLIGLALTLFALGLTCFFYAEGLRQFVVVREKWKAFKQDRNGSGSAPITQ